MNKKFSTLMAGALLALGTSAFATPSVSSKIENGKYYLLGESASSFLALDGDSVKLVTAPTNKTAREAALWKIDYTLNADGSYSYSFTNKKTGQALGLAEGKAGFGGAISSFGWGDNVPSNPDGTDGVANAIAHKGVSVPEGFAKVSIWKVYTVVEDLTLSGNTQATDAALLAAGKVKERYEVIASNAAISSANDLKDFKAVAAVTDEDLANPVKLYVTNTTNTFAGLSGGGTLKAGSIIYATGAFGGIASAAAELAVLPYDVDNVDLMSFTGTASGFADEIAPATSSSFNFDAETNSTNVMKDNKFEVVKRTLLVGTTGLGASGATGASASGSYNEVSLLKVAGQEKYLAVDTNVWVDEKGSTYHKIILAELRDLTSSVSGGVAGTKYYAPETSRMAAAYLFDVNYDSQADSLIIAPKYNLSLGSSQTYWASDTTGVASGNNAKTQVTANSAGATFQQVSLKQFSSVRELTLVSPAATTNPEKPSKISLGISTTSLNAYELASGVYFMNLVSTGGNKPYDNGKYYVAGGFASEDAQNFKHMPEAQWVVEKAKNANTVSIWNRATGTAAYTNTLFFKEGDNAFTVGGDTIKFTALTDDVVLKDSTLGYWAKEKDVEKAYKLNYYSGLDNSKFVIVDAEGDVNYLKVDPTDGADQFALEAAGAAAKYGVEKKDIAKILYKQAYRMYLVPSSKYIAAGDTMYVVYNATTNEYRIQKAKKEDAATFNLKEQNCVEGKHYYALVEAARKARKVGVKDITLRIQPEALTEVRTSAFALVEEDAPLYRRLGATIEDGLADNDINTAAFYLTRNSDRFLYENTANKIALTGDNKINYLGEFNANQFANNPAMYIDTAYVRGETNRPQYMIALRPEIGKWIPCPEGSDHPQTYEYQVKADYLVNLTDSVYGQKNSDKLFKFEEKTRLAFVPAIHHGDALIITNSKFTGNSKQIEAGKATTYASKDTIDLSKNAFNYVTFQFRLVDNGADADFYIESYQKDGASQYVQILNGVPVLTGSIADAERFNIAATELDPTANEAIEAAGVQVVGSKGAVTVQGAAGKVVTVADILGRTIANQVAASDNVTIAAPAGIVVVAVEGEATKVVVK